MRPALFLTLLLGLFLCAPEGCSRFQRSGRPAQTPDGAPSDPARQEVWQQMSDPATPFAQLTQTLNPLGPVTESPAFWNRIADSDAYSRRHRQLAVWLLWRRHIGVGGTLGDVSAVTAGTRWINESRLELVRVVTGWIPIRPGYYDPERTYVLNILPEHDYSAWQVYFTLADPVPVPTVMQVLRTGQGSTETKKTAFWEIGFGPFDETELGPDVK